MSEVSTRRSAIPSPVAQQLRTISIRGRVAYGAYCVEHAIDALGLDREGYQPILAMLWEFTSSKSLDVWEVDVYEVIGHDLPDIEQRVPGPHLLHQLLACVVEAGLDNLYAGVVDCSEGTLQPIVRLLVLLNDNGIDPPPIDPFLASRFNEYHGWGHAFTRASLLAG